MEWKFTGGLPVYQQIANIVKHGLVTGELTPGQPMIPVQELAFQARVNPNTVRRAYLELENQGILVFSETEGWVLTPDNGLLKRIRQQELRELVSSFADKLGALGMTVSEAVVILQELDKKEENEWKQF